MHKNEEELVTIAGPEYPLLCVSCREAIMRRTKVVESIHGPFHGPPLNCHLGRPEVD